MESTLHKRGFPGRTRGGEAAVFQMDAESESDSVEPLVEVLQGGAWSGGTSSPADLLDRCRVTCRARQCPPLPITDGETRAVCACIEALDRQWQVLPVGKMMSLWL